MRSAAFARTQVDIAWRSSSGFRSSSCTACGNATAMKTRQCSASPVATVSDLELDPARLAQGGCPVIDELGEPGRRALRTEEIDRRRPDQEGGEVQLVGATLEHGGNDVAPVGRDDAGHTSRRQRL